MMLIQSYHSMPPQFLHVCISLKQAVSLKSGHVPGNGRHERHLAQPAFFVPTGLVFVDSEKIQSQLVDLVMAAGLP